MTETLALQPLHLRGTITTKLVLMELKLIAMILGVALILSLATAVCSQSVLAQWYIQGTQHVPTTHPAGLNTTSNQI